jgi:hypothetical protein
MRKGEERTDDGTVEGHLDLLPEGGSGSQTQSALLIDLGGTYERAGARKVVCVTTEKRYRCES